MFYLIQILRSRVYGRFPTVIHWTMTQLRSNQWNHSVNHIENVCFKTWSMPIRDCPISALYCIVFILKRKWESIFQLKITICGSSDVCGTLVCMLSMHFSNWVCFHVRIPKASLSHLNMVLIVAAAHFLKILHNIPFGTKQIWMKSHIFF